MEKVRQRMCDTNNPRFRELETREMNKRETDNPPGRTGGEAERTQ